MPLTGPAFFAHNTEGDIVETFMVDAASDPSLGRVGAAIHLPRWFPSTQLGKAARLEPHSDFFLADPDTRKMHVPFLSRGRARGDYKYLKESDPYVNRKRFVGDTLRAQIANGRDTLITPWLIHGLSGEENELKTTLRFAEIASNHRLASGRQLLMGFEATAEVFADQSARDKMIDEIVESDAELPVYLRMTIDAPESRRPYGGRQVPALRGLRLAVEALKANDRDVVLPQSGLVGWLMLGFGASSFGAGQSASMERNTRPIANKGGGGAQPLHWYFCPDLMGPVLAEELTTLYAAGVTPCACPYCTQTPPRGGANFDAKTAALHYLWWCAHLAADLKGSPDPQAHVQARLSAAESAWAQIRTAGVALDSRSSENHVGAWIQAAS